MVVVLPAPLGPSRPYTSPGAMAKEMPSTAWTVPKLTRSSEQATGSGDRSGRAGLQTGPSAGTVSLRCRLARRG